MSQKEKKPKEPMPPLSVWVPVVALGWLIPGAGHFFLKRRGRAALLATAVAITFVLGLMMRGALFSPQTGDVLTTLIYVGGFIGNLASGLLYLLTVWLGYAQPDVAGHVHDYGTKFLVAAGLMNVLAMVDAYEIAAGRKD
jgi:TM2 domain-containing membrane protein YozV